MLKGKKFIYKGLHHWKLIPWILIYRYLNQTFKFYNSILICKKLLSAFPTYYQGIFAKWIKTTFLIQFTLYNFDRIYKI